MLIGIILGFIILVFLNYFPSRKNYKEELDFFIGKHCFHINHWVSLSIIILFVMVGRLASLKHYRFLIGILLGAILEDFMFRNIFNIRNCKTFGKS